MSIMDSSPPTFAVAGPRYPNGTPTPPPEPISSPYTYTFPHHKLKRRLTQPNKTPLVLVACGSFSPITTLHLQMFEMSERYAKDSEFEVVGKYLSPVSDAYGKSSLVPAFHRIAMSTLAAEDECNTKIMVDPWETLRHDEEGEPVYTRTVDALRHFDYEINDVLGGIQAMDGTPLKARVVLLIGADVAMTMGDPKVWSPSDLGVLLGYYGAFIVERPTQTDIQEAIKPLSRYHDTIWVVNSFYNDVSSTKIRAQLQNGENVMDLPDPVYEYIKLHQLYQRKPTKEINGTTDKNSDKNSASANVPNGSNR